MHMLAYLFDPEEPACSPSASWSGTTGCRAPGAWSPGSTSWACPVTWEQVARIAGDGSVGRRTWPPPSVELGVVPTVNDAFTDDRLADGGRALRGEARDPTPSRRTRG